MAAKYCKPRLDAGPTRYLYVSGIGHQLGTNPQLVHDVFQQFGPLEDDDDAVDGAINSAVNGVEMIDNKRFCFVVYKDIASAMLAMEAVNGKAVEALGNIKVFIRYAEVNTPPQEKPVPECTSLSAGVNIPGLRLIEEFVSLEEELNLMESVCSPSADWEQTLNRRVQHFGFKFNYRTLLLDYSSEIQPIPTLFRPMIDRIITEHSAGPGDFESKIVSGDQINQLTLNEYLPGQGIASHIDTLTCFGDAIFIVSLGAGVTMMLQQKTSERGNDDDDAASTGIRKHMWLPPRSLLILCGPARHSWSHCISSRTSDQVNGELIERSRRVSLTFRQAILPGNIPSQQLRANELEKDHVFRVYENIAVHWNHTRGKRKVHWHLVKDFLETLPPGSLLADVGSGDGKYFGVNPNVTVIGCDRSLKLLQVSREPSHETFCCDAVKLPFQSDMFDATICIAVLHHLASIDRRAAVLRELVRITAYGGQIMVQAWAQEQDEASRHDFAEQDVLVPWRLQKRFFLSETQSKTGVVVKPHGHDAALADNANSQLKKKGRQAKLKKRLAREAFRAQQQSHSNGEEGLETEAVLIDDQIVTESSASTDSDQQELASKVENDTENNGNLIESEAKLQDVAEPVVDSSNSTSSSSNVEDTIEGTCEHAVDEGNQIVFQRYCHVYKRGELEDLCSSIPNCRILESGWEKGNWFVKLLKVSDSRLYLSCSGPERPLQPLNTRSLTQSATVVGGGTGMSI